MDADLDTLCTTVYVTADDLLPAQAPNARRMLDDAEVVTLAVAQVVMGIPSDRRFLAVARARLCHLFPALPNQPAYFKRRLGLRGTIDWLAGVFAARSPGFEDEVVLLDSTPVECGRSLETARRSALAEWAGYGWSRSHSRFFWGMRLHLCCAPDGTPRRAKDEPQTGRPRLGRIRQRVESVFWTFKDILSLERHGARTPEGLRARVGARILALAACVWLNHQLGRPSRSLVAYVA